MSDEPSNPIPTIPAEVAARIDQYARPTSLSADVAAQVLPGLKDLVRAAGPRSPEDAKNLLSVGCMLIADAIAHQPGETPVAGLDVRDLVTDQTLAFWSHRASERGTSASALSRYLLYMRRVVRARNGLPPRVCVPTTRVPATPISRESVARLFELLNDDPAAARILLEAVTLGASSSGVGRGGRATVQGAGRWAVAGDSLRSVPLDKDAHKRLRHTASRAGIDFDRHMLALRWAVDVIDGAPTAFDALVAIQSRLLTGDAVPHARRMGEADLRSVLRG